MYKLSKNLEEDSGVFCEICGDSIAKKYYSRDFYKKKDKESGRVLYRLNKMERDSYENLCCDCYNSLLIKSRERERESIIEVIKYDEENRKDFYNITKEQQLLAVTVYSIVKGDFRNASNLTVFQKKKLESALKQNLIHPYKMSMYDEFKDNTYYFDSFTQCDFSFIQEINNEFIANWIRNNADYYVRKTMNR